MLIKVGEIDKVRDLTTGGEHHIFTWSLLAAPAIENGSVIPKWPVCLVVRMISRGDTLGGRLSLNLHKGGGAATVLP